MQTQTGFSWNPFKKTATTTAEEAVVDIIKLNAQALVDGEVKVTATLGDHLVTVHLEVPKEDLGKIIGKQGKTAQALRTILNCVAARYNMRSILEVVE